MYYTSWTNRLKLIDKSGKKDKREIREREIFKCSLNSEPNAQKGDKKRKKGKGRIKTCLKCSAVMCGRDNGKGKKKRKKKRRLEEDNGGIKNQVYAELELTTLISYGKSIKRTITS